MSWVRIPIFVALWLVVGCSRTPKIALDPSKEESLPPVTATASVDRALISTDDPVTFTVLINREKTIELNLPDIGSRISGFRIVDFGGEEKNDEGNRKILRKWFSLRADVSGSYVLPEVEINYIVAGQPKTAKTSEIFVEVTPTNTEATPTGEDLRDIKNLERAPINYVAWGVAALSALSILGIYLWKRRKKKVIEAPQWLPHEAALRRLDELPLPNASDPTSIKHFYFELSEIVRFYVEGRYGFRATDMTSEEIVLNLRNNSSLPESEKPAFIELLEETDIVKFTDFYPASEATLTVKDRAKNFIFRTRSVEVTKELESVV